MGNGGRRKLRDLKVRLIGGGGGGEGVVVISDGGVEAVIKAILYYPELSM